MTELLFDSLESEIGQIYLVSDGKALCAVDFEDYRQRMMGLLNKRYGSVNLVPTNNPQGYRDRFQAYFSGDLTSLDDIPVNPGGTAFQQEVWQALRTIPVGSVATYAELADRIHRPQACRAVGMANSQNPIAIVLPCHRVVGANGNLTGYAGGLERKRWLLDHEKKHSCLSASVELPTRDFQQMDFLALPV